MNASFTESLNVALDYIDEDDDGAAATALGDVIDRYGMWGWIDSREHRRLAIVQTDGAYWCVYRGEGPDAAWRVGTLLEAVEKMREMTL